MSLFLSLSVLLRGRRSALSLLFVRSTAVRRRPFSLPAATDASRAPTLQYVLGWPPSTHGFDSNKRHDKLERHVEDRIGSRRGVAIYDDGLY